MKKYILVFLLLLPIIHAGAQSFEYGNDWYKSDPDRTFIKLIVEKDGIYRASAQDFLDAGFDLSAIDPNNLHLYYRGVEVPMYISKSGGSLNYLEFFGKRNDGAIDSLMYRNPVSGLFDSNQQPDADISLFSDESAYFLTWTNTPSAERYFNLFDPTYTLFTPETDFKYTSREGVIISKDTYVRGGGGSFDSFYTLNSDYVTGEGYRGKSFGYGTPATQALSTPFPANKGNPIDVHARVFGRSNTPHILKIVLNGDNNNPVIDTIISTSKIYIKTYRNSYLPSGSLSNTTDLTFIAERANTDNNAICWSSITYDRLPNMNADSSLRISSFSKSGKAYFKLDNAVGDDTVLVYDVKNRIRNVGLMTGNSANIIVEGLANTRDLFVATDRGIRKPKIQSSAFNKLFDPTKGGSFVIITHRGLKASAEAYAAYRDTATVTSVTSRIVYTDEIYDEFGYGTITPWAIKRFCKYALDNWQTKPEYFLLWGKGKFQTRGYENQTIVPSFGYPATDYEFISHFDPNSPDINPEAAIGRVNIYNDVQGLGYLDKVNEYEHTEWSPWMKEAIHLGGGATLGEQASIEGTFTYVRDIFTDVPYGGKSHYFQKRSDDIVIDPTAAPYHDEISGGTHIIHFFGHSTSNILDISIRNPNTYNNYGKYPLMLAMGCYGGDFTVDGFSFGEGWILEEKRGAIGYMANSSAGYLNPLRDYGRIFYQKLYNDMLGEPLGKVIQSFIQTYTDSLSGIQYRNHARQMNLQGDPAVRLYAPKKPDLEVNQSSVYFTPTNFSSQDDSFRINVIVNNLALVDQDSFVMTLKQRIPSGTVFNHPTTTHPMVRFRDTISLSLNNPAGNLITGQNSFEVFVDAPDSIPELEENNNRINIQKIVPGNIPAILYPLEFAIVGENNISLEASSFFMTQEENVGYIFEIDTTAEFNSPSLVNSGLITGTATYSKWDVPFSLVDSTVYFWRVRLRDVTPIVWSSSSFKYIKNRTGWAQAKIEQFESDTKREIILDNLQKKWRFEQFGSDYEITTTSLGNFIYSINGSLAGHPTLYGYYLNSVAVVVIDQHTLEPVSNSIIVDKLLMLKSPSEMYKLIDVILNVKHGDYVIIGSHRNPLTQTWINDPGIMDALKQIGASENLKLLDSDDPFLIMGRKGFPGSATETFSPGVGGLLRINTRLLSTDDNGSIVSTRIGPALDWQSLFWGWKSEDPIPEETAFVSAFAVRNDGTDSLVYLRVTKGSYDLTGIDAKEFPYMRLSVNVQDSINRTPPQMDNWHVLYTPAPDGAVDPLINFAFEKDTVYEGEDIFIHMGARNISQRDMDSLKVKLYIDRKDRSRLLLDSLRLAPLLANKPSLEFEYRFNTLNKNLEGEVNLIVEINPDFDQPESHVFNNIYIQPFFVKVDNENPIMDVTIDGKHIIDGDIVSPNPEILIEVNDENPFVALDDPEAFDLGFKFGTTSATNFEQIFVQTDPRVEWTPAELPANKAQLRFYPGKDSLLRDGDYTLRVQGKDKKGNAAGEGDNFYEIRFKVVSESSVTHMLNYPNPFSTSTRFVYTLTGMELPELFQIHIYTISGKMVKVIDLKEMGDLHIGRNITNYAWDGTDEYGDRLANGVYLYKVVSRMPSQELKLREEGIEQYFNNGWGKMYLMR